VCVSVCAQASARDPLRELVHSLIEETKRVAPPPPPRPASAKQERPPPPPPAVEVVKEVPPAQEEWGAFKEEAPLTAPEPEPPSPSPPSLPPPLRPPPPPPAEPPAAPVPRTPEPASIPPPPRAPTPPPAPPVVSPRAAPGSDGYSSDGGHSHASFASYASSRVRATRTFLTSTRRTPAPRERKFRQRSGIKPLPGDVIKRLPRVSVRVGGDIREREHAPRHEFPMPERVSGMWERVGQRWQQQGSRGGVCSLKERRLLAAAVHAGTPALWLMCTPPPTGSQGKLFSSKRPNASWRGKSMLVRVLYWAAGAPGAHCHPAPACNASAAEIKLWTPSPQRRSPHPPNSLVQGPRALFLCCLINAELNALPNCCAGQVVALYHELGKGVVADTVGWQSTKPKAAKRGTGDPAAAADAPAAAKSASRPPPGRLRPGAAGKQQGAGGAAAAVGPRKGVEHAEAAEAVEAGSSLSAADQAQLAAQVAAFKAASLVDAADFVDELRERGAGEAGGAGWPKEKWATVCEAAEVYDNLRRMAVELSQWAVDVQVSSPCCHGRACVRACARVCQGGSGSSFLCKTRGGERGGESRRQHWQPSPAAGRQGPGAQAPFSKPPPSTAPPPQRPLAPALKPPAVRPLHACAACRPLLARSLPHTHSLWAATALPPRRPAPSPSRTAWPPSWMR
jgi:hypothetical protein